jgi:GlpG protein
MRVIAKFSKEVLAKRFSAYLSQNKIENTFECIKDYESNEDAFMIWVHNEDNLREAKSLLDEFNKNPLKVDYDIAPKEQIEDENEEGIQSETPVEKVNIELPRKSFFPKKKTILQPHKITWFFLIFCVGVFLISSMQKMSASKKEYVTQYYVTPVQYYMMFDVPKIFIEVGKFVQKYKIDSDKKFQEMFPIIEREIAKKDASMNYWRGLYSTIAAKALNPQTKWNFSGKMFEKIRQGQVWRLITPCFLHLGLLHILFNMMWLWILGFQIEPRLSKLKYVLLILIVGIISNIFQYLVSGSNFLGFSGVIMGMVGFIYSRQKVAPWEGYPLQKPTILFLLFFILAMFALQVLSFILLILNGDTFIPNIANTAHIVGGLVGLILGRLQVFAWRPIER